MKSWFSRRKPEPELPPVVRPHDPKPISELEVRRLAHKGVWLTIQVQVTPKGTWCNWKHNIPEDLTDEARNALAALCLKLQGDD